MYYKIIYDPFVLFRDKVLLLVKIEILLRGMLMGKHRRRNIICIIGLMVLIVGEISFSNRSEADTNMISSSGTELSKGTRLAISNNKGNIQKVNQSSHVIKSMYYDGEDDAMTTPTPSVAQKYNITPETTNSSKPSSRIAKLKTTLSNGDECNYVDNKGNLNAFSWEYSANKTYKYISVLRYQLRKDGTIKEKRITWNEAADKTMNLVCTEEQFISFMTHWIDEKTGDFYFIVSKWGFEGNDYPSYVYGIHPNGKLFVHSQVEHHLIMDKIDSNYYACGYYINYIGQKNGIAYFNYKDNSRFAVLSYSMKKHQFIKQIFTDNYVIGIIDNHFVGTDMNCMLLGSIPEGKKEKLENGNSILTGKSIISKVYILPEYKRINIYGKYVYLLTKTQYQRIHPGEDSWEMLADVTDIVKQAKGDLYLDRLMPSDSKVFSLLWYADCGAGYYIEQYHVKK